MDVGFLVHPTSRDPERSRRKLAAKFRPLGWFPAKFVHDVIMPRLPVKMLGMGEATGIISSATGQSTKVIYWAETRDPERMLKDQRVDRLIKAARCCAKRGAELIGLGAYTAIIGGYGQQLAERMNKLGVFVTTGNSLTAFSGVEGLLHLAKQVGYNPAESTAAVIGAGGSTGAVAAQLLAEAVGRMLLVGSAASDLSNLASQIGKSKAGQVTLAEALCQANLIVAVTSQTSLLDINPSIIRPGAIICDIARPRDIGEIVRLKRPDDVLVFDGAILQIPGDNYDCQFDYDFPVGTTYACMAETMVLGLEGCRENFSLGKTLDLDRVKEIGKLAKLHGFSLAGYRAFDQEIHQVEIERFRDNLRKVGNYV